VPWAIKRLLPGSTNAPTLARFVDEVRIAGGLDHPNVVPIHDVGVDEEGRYFFVMKYVQGETLENVIEKLRANDPDTVRAWSFEKRVEIMLGLLRALSFAHAKGILHRDVKPANVMIGRFGEVMLMDWGIAKRIQGDTAAVVPDTQGDAPSVSVRASLKGTQRGAMVGTPAYMSPEQAKGSIDLDARTDLYSACVLFHELCALGHYLEDAPDLAALITRIQNTNWTAIQLSHGKVPHAPRVPAELAHFLAKGLANDPARRFQNADEMIERLQAILEGSFEVQCPVTFTKKATRLLSKLVDRAPFVVLGTGVTVAGLVGFALLELGRLAIH
jgi:serine/threonine-protein kinase